MSSRQPQDRYFKYRITSLTEAGKYAVLVDVLTIHVIKALVKLTVRRPRRQIIPVFPVTMTETLESQIIGIRFLICFSRMDISERRVLVTGGPGFIYSHLAEFLLDRNNNGPIVDDTLNNTQDGFQTMSRLLRPI